ncbi:3-oxoadipate enol-lactonase [Deinococcus sp. S9]|uniref:bifunctional 3-oxoadipate enol-lactonase/4-carboxymuconolactone decarboxylase PcaDC n=1 Tax=Deinococcus sp. S9 TaxID=2545754 RepID=UPI001054F40D|nr:3-oxoadipate enol-lactonase [Deinococcus sp. S9]TDE85257.1 3-oxoadipate enol-lactonase [Deinococcus sp. S9]
MTFLDTGSLVLHLQSIGSEAASPLVFLNPIGSDLRVWDEVAGELRSSFRIIQYDLRGQGLSDVPGGEYSLEHHVADLLGLLDALGLEQVALVGCSLGGVIAQALALSHPARVARLVLLDTLPRIGTAESWQTRIAQVSAEGLPALAPTLIRRWFAPAFFQEQPTAAHGYTTLLARSPQDGYLGSCAALRDADLTAQLQTLRIPTLVLCGEHDISTPPDACRALADQISARFALIRGAAHLPMVERPHEVARLLRDFLGEKTATGRYDQGMAVRRRVLGDAHVDRANAAVTDLDGDFQTFITEYAWGGPWSRSGLDLRTRHLLTLAVLTALPREHELEMHVRATRNTGVTEDDLREVFLQVAVYAGVPVANRAFQIAKRVLSERNDP